MLAGFYYNESDTIAMPYSGFIGKSYWWCNIRINQKRKNAVTISNLACMSTPVLEWHKTCLHINLVDQVHWDTQGPYWMMSRKQSHGRCPCPYRKKKKHSRHPFFHSHFSTWLIFNHYLNFFKNWKHYRSLFLNGSVKIKLPKSSYGMFSFSYITILYFFKNRHLEKIISQ